MRIIITGNTGYVGSVLVGHLRRQFPTADLIGYDSGLFAACLTGTGVAPENNMTQQILGDVRDMTADLFVCADAVVHLAAISNDPMGARFEAVTDDINYRASVRCALLARDAGVRSFVFASSCSVYGFAAGSPRNEQDDVHPLTAYARSKLATEIALRDAHLGGMNVTCLRFATACGSSNRLRLDLVLNDFVASAVADKRIGVLSDGTPWRPLIDVTDMARAIEWAIGRSRDQGGQFLSINAGSNRWNYRVSDLATAVAEEVGGVEVAMNPNAVPDKRSYQVDFSLYEALAPQHQPVVDLSRSIRYLLQQVSEVSFADKEFRERCTRLKVLEEMIEGGRLSADLRWRPALAFDATRCRPSDRTRAA